MTDDSDSAFGEYLRASPGSAAAAAVPDDDEGIIREEQPPLVPADD